MALDRSACLALHICSGRTPNLVALALGIFLSAATSAPVVAQPEAPASTLAAERYWDSICDVQTTDAFGPVEGTAEHVVAHCRGQGLVLGRADEFEVVENKVLGAVLVDMRRGSERRLLLISLQEDRPPLLEDISGQIAMLAGRAPTSPLDGIEIDVTGFAGDGAIALRGGAAGVDRASSADRINLGRQIADARASRRGTPARF